MKKIVYLIILFLTACTSKPAIRIETKIVEVPKLYCPKPPNINIPILPIYTIDDRDNLGDIAVKYKTSIKALQLHIESLNKIIESYK